jgi:hypothetical protein
MGGTTRIASSCDLHHLINIKSRSGLQVAVDNAEMGSASRKRPLSEVKNTNSAPASKRQEVEPKSPKTAIRVASEALIEAIRKAEEVHLHPAKSNPKSSPTKVSRHTQKQDVKADSKTASWEFEKDKPTGLPYIYIVLEKSLIRSTEELGEDVFSTFVTLQDANNFVRNYCADNAERDDPDALFSEDLSPDGRISWTYEDEKGYGTEIRIEKCVINAPGSIPAQDWGRPIGAPCPPKEDSEVESSSDEEWNRRYEKDIGYRTRLRH